MIRPAKSTDAFALATLLANVHATTVYNGIAIDAAFSRKLFAQFAHRHGGSHDGATCLFVQDREGVICGFVAGMLDRVYHVGDDLWATDVFLHAAKDAPASTVTDLLAAYVEWAQNNQRVYEVRLSASFATREGRRIGKLYERMGFEECARVYRRANPNFEQATQRVTKEAA